MSITYEDLIPYLEYLDVNFIEDKDCICSSKLYELLGSNCRNCKLTKVGYTTCPLRKRNNMQEILYILKEKHPELFI